MAHAPYKGLKFTIDNREVVFGCLDNGDAEVVVLAVEKAEGANDYSWEVQQSIEYLMLSNNGDIHAAMEAVLNETNEVLQKLFGKVETPVTDFEKFQVYILSNLRYDPSTNTIRRA